MATDSRDVIGNWLGAIGTTIGAVGQTKDLFGRHIVGQHLWIAGKGTQGVGAAIQAVAEDENVLAELGNWLISAGSSTVSAVGVKDLPNAYEKEAKKRFGIKHDNEPKKQDEVDNKKLIVIANALQAKGAFIVASQRDHPKRKVGGFIQSYGAFIEALGTLTEISSDEKTAQYLAVLGAWLQAAGISLQAVGTTEQFIEDNAEGEDTDIA
ncbi:MULTISPECIES: DUF6944 family repetitive protein [Bacillaceae]|uniref:Uncharacterized protein n=1 Tax=Evansella alkalicola TaxID=745819 RepID=A0ABS6JX24_9BACI|nr:MULTISPECIES: hypothetical protein [Bacillaceae]MBU9723048.1 hypothetical protein [Bacillus alkalicola]